MKRRDFASVALAQMGYDVLSIDICQTLLDELKSYRDLSLVAARLLRRRQI